jgi:hypothetical protein
MFEVKLFYPFRIWKMNQDLIEMAKHLIKEYRLRKFKITK